MNSIIPKEYAGKRFDHVLVEMLPDQSRSRIQRMVKDGVITLNGKKVAPHHFLKGGEQMDFAEQESAPPAMKDISAPYKIIVETPEYIVVDKHAGVVVHSGVRHEHDTLVDALLKKYPEIRGAGEDPMRPGIVHRLDKDASGIMVVARTHDSFESLMRQFKLRLVKKQYSILVYGAVVPKEGVIDFPLSRSKQKYTKRAAGSKEGVPAVTRYSVEQSMKHVSLVRVQPETGRTHQIRVHFFAKGNPIVGDKIYLSKKIKPVFASRLMLHAVSLGFKDLAGEWHEYMVTPDEDFQRVVRDAEGA